MTQGPCPLCYVSEMAPHRSGNFGWPNTTCQRGVDIHSQIVPRDFLRYLPQRVRLVEQFGHTRVMMGTDDPFNFHDSTPGNRIKAAIPDEAIRQALMHGNAERFLGRTAVTA